MIGIAHHSPVVISVLLDRSRFLSQTINPDDVSSWRNKVSEFSRAPKDGRARVLFIDQLATLQALMKDGAEFDGIKVLIYDSLDVLRHIENVTIIDTDVVSVDGKTETAVMYRLLPDALNNAIATAVPGVDEDIVLINFKVPLPELQHDTTKKPRGRKPKKTPEPEPDPEAEREPDEDTPPIADVMDDPEDVDDDPDPEPEPEVEAATKGKKGKKKTKKHPTVTNKRLFG